MLHRLSSRNHISTTLMTMLMGVMAGVVQLAAAQNNPELGFEPLPEGAMTKSVDGQFTAFYARPTHKYQHGILGDSIEAEQLVVIANGQIYSLDLPSDEVFEDIQPRLVDVNHDGQPEIITIRTHIHHGAGIAIYQLSNDTLSEFAYISPIGRTHRWLNIAAIADLDQDGTIEIAWVETPHIGGIFKVARIQAGELKPIAKTRGYSNHTIGERNLCLSVLSQENNQITLYVPTQNRQKVVGFQLSGNRWKIVDETTMPIVFAQPLASQYIVKQPMPSGNPCAIKFL